MAQYGLTSYWDERYKRDPEFFDWYQKWENLREFIRPHIDPSHRILIIGCGLSRLSEGMYNDGYTNQLNIDVSKVAIERMSQLYQDKPSMEFVIMDAMDLSPLNQNSFDVAIDKGTLDSILCGESSATNVAKFLKEVSRVLRDHGGQYICITYGQPSFRLPYLERVELQWDVQIISVPKPLLTPDASFPNSDPNHNAHYIYICTRKPDTNSKT